MEPARLQKIIEPLEKMLSKKGFQIDGEPMVDGAVRMASFVRPDGVKVDYTLEVRKDLDRGNYASDSDVHLDPRLYKDGQTITLNPYFDTSSNMPAQSLVADMVEETIQPNIEQHL